jgi:colanic acid/amylovoran biosynthesis glycosyltransferase
VEEIEELGRHVSVITCSIVADADPTWRALTSGSRWSLRPFGALLRQAIRHPRSLTMALATILAASWRSPRDLAVALRAAGGACLFHEAAKPSLIHAQFAGPAAAAAYVWSAISGVPWTVRAHAYDIYTPYRWARRILLDAHRVYAISEHGQRHLESILGVPSSVLHVGIDPAKVPARTHQLPGDTFRFISVGALTEKKGHDRAIAAVQLLIEQGVAIELHIFGEGPLRQPLLAKLRDARSIVLKGHVPHRALRETYRDYDGFILTPVQARDGDLDGIPVVIMEAMAARLPVFATRAGGIPELVSDTVTGTLLPEEPNAMASAIWTGLAEYEALQRMATQAETRVRLEYDVATLSQRLSQEWLAILQSAPEKPV